MVKKGPCLHCGVTATPLWRNGPAEKPVLCNACGSRYKLRGNLENYLPKNVQLQLCSNNPENLNGKSNLNAEVELPSHISHSGGINPRLWNSKIPSKKRSLVVYKRMTPMEKFQKQLLKLWRCQKQTSGKSSPEEVFLMDNVNNFIPSNEIGLGVILIKPNITSTESDH